MRKYWTEEEDDILRDLWNNENVTMEDMMKVLVGRTESAISNRTRRLGLPSPTFRNKSTINYEYYRKLMEVVEG